MFTVCGVLFYKTLIKSMGMFIIELITRIAPVEKGSQLKYQASQAAQSAQDSMQQAGQQMKASAQGATDAAKDATGMNK
ncbi:hypothetical protein L1987_05555 [Smallanthus sonchifolius]|uniref:Uncharacterized protein n=1 Tax=Smallanthus sonchifolius TaxID=185202 RepID=A0ACB9JVP6_9ASTR|nr:hypothetical protein L1987_05555 [Smallanthus sonchifolius]